MSGLFEILNNAQRHKSVLYDGGEESMRGVIEGAFPGRNDLQFVECGTYQGVSAWIMSMYGAVHTVDIDDRAHRCNLTHALGQHAKQIAFYVEPDRDRRLAVLDALTTGPFDMGHEDASHRLADIEDNFRYLKRCGLVLFHDYDGSQPDVSHFLDELGKTEHVIRRGVFGLWVAHDHPYTEKLFGRTAQQCQ